MIRYVLALIALFIAGAIFFWYTKPTYDSIQSIKDESAQYDAALAKTNELQQLKEQLLQRYKSFSPNDLDRVQKMIPDHIDNITLMMDLDNFFSIHKFPVTNVNVSISPTTGVDQAGPAAIGVEGQKYDSVSINFSTQGTYAELKTLLDALQKALRVLDITQLALHSAGKSATGEDQYGYDLALRTYWLK